MWFYADRDLGHKYVPVFLLDIMTGLMHMRAGLITHNPFKVLIMDLNSQEEMLASIIPEAKHGNVF